MGHKSTMQPETLAVATARYASDKANAPKGIRSRQRRAQRIFSAFNLTRVLVLGEGWNSYE